ncbi:MULTISPECIES: hypothetical protein [Streptomyces]|uniref:hypothetical protein n=1 Tax=Streptomyces TaxID=1883 RepID=UPI00073DE070|nr:hypothetical protein [Streptomyces sp. FBKL.4005]MYU28611.1 hypothetical protein [Streptomyces sp. SID7810]OYP17011.1 hypothetical protein CFC35_22960 [Streptomyces sp. FBKL.4005]CUW29649.1 hypothetical protein TUE45_04358 [Streptomyces reticuli]
MDQATAPTPRPPTDDSGQAPERAAYKQASALADRIVHQLRTLPRSVTVVGELSGFSVRLNFGTNEPAGVLEVAEIADVEARRSPNGSGYWFEARAVMEGIPVCAEVLLSEEAARAFEDQCSTATAHASPGAVSAPVPLGDSPLAQAAAITPVQPVATERLDDEDEARCVRCGCTANAPCVGGCHWVPNQQMVDLCSACATIEELQTGSYIAADTDVLGGVR